MSEHECKCGWPDCPKRPADDERARSVLFNDVTKAPLIQWLHLGDRQALRDYLWERGWRREVRDDDVTERWDEGELFRSVDDPEAAR